MSALPGDKNVDKNTKTELVQIGYQLGAAAVPSELPLDKSSLLDVQKPLPRELEEGEQVTIAVDETKLSLEKVLLCVKNHFPSLLAAAAEQDIADGKVLSAIGQFDLQAKAATMNQPFGYYQNYRSGVTLTQPVFETGGYVYGRYKVGLGDFPVWYKNRQTDGNGEYAVGFGLPLLKDRAIDKQRAELYRSNVDSQAVSLMVRGQLILCSRESAYAYWEWLARGLSLQVQKNLLSLAQTRVDQIALRVERGDLPEIARIDNDRLIAARQTKLIEATRKFQAAAIKLSLFFRDADGHPLIPDISQLPHNFPSLPETDPTDQEADIARAIENRPEVRELNLELQKVQVDLKAAKNQYLPKLDALIEASKDTGTPTSPIEDKTPFEMEAALLAEVPLQRRDALGKLRSAKGKQTQLLAKREFVINKISVSVQDAHSAILNARDRLNQAEKNKSLAIRSLEVGRQQFAEGDIDLIVLNIYEQAEADAELQVIDAENEYYSAWADYHAAIGENR